MAKKQITMQLSPVVITAIEKESKKTKKPKQFLVDNRLKASYGIKEAVCRD